MMEKRFIPRRVRRRHWNPNGGANANIPCGLDYIEGWHNVDGFAPTADRRVDLFEFPWPIKDASFDNILCSHFIEHVPPRLPGNPREDALALCLREFERILRPGGTLLIRTPYGTRGFDSHLHYRFFNFGTFGFLEGSDQGTRGYETNTRLRLIWQGYGRRGLRFGKYLNSVYHIPKYLGLEPNIGRGWELLVVLRKEEDA